MKRIVLERKNKEKRYGDDSRRKLEEMIKKNHMTTMIGAISRFEDYFGHLWGHGKLNLSVEEQAMKTLWDNVRKRILDLGNDKLKATIYELGQYTILHKSFVDLPSVDQEEESDE